MKQTKVLLVSIKSVQVGIFIVSATEVLELDDSIIDNLTGFIGSNQQTFIKGVAKLEYRLLNLLDLEKILMSEEISKVQKIWLSKVHTSI